MMALRTLALLAVALLAACQASRGMLEAKSRVKVSEVWRSQMCNAPDSHSRAFLFQDREALRAWAEQRKLALPGHVKAGNPYALVDLGMRNTGGYGIAVSRDAIIRSDGVVVLHATLVRPSAGGRVAQVVTSPCALVALPAGGRYAVVSVFDEDDDRIASSSDEPSDSWWPF